MKAGIYIHVPYCLSKCNYCDFYSVINYEINNYHIYLINELKSIKNNWNNIVFDTLYFGGGTPSLLKANQINYIINEIKLLLNTNLVEITIEVNPEDINYDYINELKTTEINRISIGIQSLNNSVLSCFGRRHDRKKALNSIKSLTSNYNNVSIDIIYGYQNHSIKNFENELDLLLETNVQHISAYNLTISENTKFYKESLMGNYLLASDDISYNLYNMLINKLKQNNFYQYEISNFAKINYHSLHNSKYWKLVPYLGLGPSAHSFNNNIRYWNNSNIDNYINGNYSKEEEELSKIELINELIMNSLRTTSGINIKYFEKIAGKERSVDFQKKISQFIPKKVNKTTSGYSLNTEGMFISDYIISKLFI